MERVYNQAMKTMREGVLSMPLAPQPVDHDILYKLSDKFLKMRGGEKALTLKDLFGA